MLANEIFAGPILRRAQPDRVTIWLATRVRLELSFWVRVVGQPDWLGQTATLTTLKVLPELYVYLAIVTPQDGKSFPTNTLLEYSIAVGKPGDEDHTPFRGIAAEDGLTYAGFSLPTFYLQARDQKLNVLYASCRKFHDSNGGVRDALAFGDGFVRDNRNDLTIRPAVLCLLGDQIYADDVHPVAFDEVTSLAARMLGGDKDETLPDGLTLPGAGKRQKFVRERARFTSDAAANHLVTFAEYSAMYGLAWRQHNWRFTKYPPEIQGCYDDLPGVRRLLANVATYMIFDDHDVTDDWNLSVDWVDAVGQTNLGRRILTNATYAYWLFQGWGNDPARYEANMAKIVELNDIRVSDPGRFRASFREFEEWEFHTPTRPFIYFLDTRTKRTYRDGFRGMDGKAPAYLKNRSAWASTFTKLIDLRRTQSREYPLVLVAPGPVFGFDRIDAIQGLVSAVAGPYVLDFESWAANLKHLRLFLMACGDQDVLVLSGDVHYGYTTTITVSTFDDDFFRDIATLFPIGLFPARGAGPKPTYQFLYTARFLQLTSSAAKNFAHADIGKVATFGKNGLASLISNSTIYRGTYRDGVVKIEAADQPTKPEDIKLGCAVAQRFNDVYNTPVITEHNIGFVQIDKRKIRNAFLVSPKLSGARSWDFANSVYWGP